MKNKVLGEAGAMRLVEMVKPACGLYVQLNDAQTGGQYPDYSMIPLIENGPNLFPYGDVDDMFQPDTPGYEVDWPTKTKYGQNHNAPAFIELYSLIFASGIIHVQNNHRFNLIAYAFNDPVNLWAVYEGGFVMVSRYGAEKCELYRVKDDTPGGDDKLYEEITAEEVRAMLNVQ